MATYTPPGVFVTDSSNANYSTSAVSPSSVGIFGEALAALSYVETVAIPADIPESEDLEGDIIPSQPVASQLLRHPNATSVTVTRIDNGELLTLGTDYELVTTKVGDDTYSSVKRIFDSTFIPSAGATVSVSYDYALSNFHETLRFTNAMDVAMFYGDAFDANGNIQSPLTLAARLAFDNGATSVITRATLDNTEQEYLNALTELNKAKDIAVITCASGDGSLAGAISLATKTASAQELERRAIIGLDGTSNSISTESLITTAKQISNNRVALVVPTVVDYRVVGLNRVVSIGGQYLAAAIAGIAVSLNVQEPLTRKSVFGFAGIPDVYDTTTKNALAAAGCMVVEETLQGVVRIRHGVTTDTTSKNNSEWSVVGVTDYVISTARSMLDNAGFVGSAITPATVPSLLGMMTAFLSTAVMDNVIGNYDSLTVLQREAEPDVIDIRFAVSFMFPLNRIYVTMTSSASTGSTDITVV